MTESDKDKKIAELEAALGSAAMALYLETKTWCEPECNCSFHGVLLEPAIAKFRKRQEAMEKVIEAAKACFDFKQDDFKLDNCLINDFTKALADLEEVEREL